MKRLFVFLIPVIVGVQAMSAGFGFSTNDAFNVPDPKATNNVFVVLKDGSVRSASTITADGGVTLNGTSAVSNLTVAGTASVTGATTLKTTTAGALTVQTNASVGGTLGVTGVATFTATPVLLNGVTVGTNAVIGGDATVGGNASVVGTLSVTGATDLVGGIVGGASVTQTFYTVVAGTQDCITNIVVTRQGITTSITQP